MGALRRFSSDIADFAYDLAIGNDFRASAPGISRNHFRSSQQVRQTVFRELRELGDRTQSEAQILFADQLQSATGGTIGPICLFNLPEKISWHRTRTLNFFLVYKTSNSLFLAPLGGYL